MALWKGAGVRVMKDRWCRALCSRAEIGVFWDFNKCGVEDAEVESEGEGEGEDEGEVSRIAPNIVQALRSSGFAGPISIRAYGNTRSFSNHHATQALLATGVDLHHISGGTKYLCKHIILDLLLWVRENSPPAHMLLISGDKEFSSVLHKLHMRGYDVLLAHPEGDISRDLLSAASKVWVWDRMMKGTEQPSILPPKHNGLQHSYRSHNHIESQCSHNQEVQPELDVKNSFLCQDLRRKPQKIPKKVVEQVHAIIRLRPTGFTVAAFRRQLARSNVNLDKDFYGQKDLLSFLLAVPNLKARLIWTSDKTRTFLFSEDSSGSTNVNNDSKGALPTSLDHNKDIKQETVKAKEEKGHSGIKVENVSYFQQLDNISPKKPSKESNVEMSLGVDFPSDSATESQGLFSGGTSALSAAWNRAVSKLIALTKFWQFVGPDVAKTESKNIKMPLCKEGEETKPTNQVNAELNTSSVLSPYLEDEKKGETLKSRETREGDGHKVMHEVSGYGALELEDEQDNRRRHVLKRRKVLAFSAFTGKQQTTFGKRSVSEAQGRQSELLNEVEATSPLLQEGEVSFNDAMLTDEICEDVLFHLLNEGSTLLTKSITVDDVLNFVLKSNLKIIAELKHEELVQLAKICQERVLLQIENRTCNRKAKAGESERLLAEKGSTSAPILTIMCNICQHSVHEGGINDDIEICSRSSTDDKDSSSFKQSMPDSAMREAVVSSEMLEAEVRSDLKEMLLDLLQMCENGVELGSVKPEFRTRYGYELDNRALGYSKLSSLLSTLEGFTVTGRHSKKLILRSSEYAVDKDSVEERDNSTSGGLNPAPGHGTSLSTW